MTNAAAGESGAFEIVVASLASAVERRRRVEAMLAGSPWKWRLFDACTTPREDIPYDERAARIQRGRALSRAEVCTFATHYTILRDFAEGAGEGCLMVLEDDVLIDGGFPFERLPRLMAAAGIDMLRLYSRFLYENRRVAEVGTRHHLVRFKRPVFGLQAYVVTREGARRTTAPIRRIVRPGDDEFDRFWANGVPLYALYPYPAIELEGPSTMLGRETMEQNAADDRPGILFRLHHRLEKLRRFAANARLRRRDYEIRRRLRGFVFP